MKKDNVDRIGLTFEMIEENDLTWINNLTSSSGKKPDLSKPLYKDWIEQFGKRKCEANAFLTKEKVAQDILRTEIQKYLGEFGRSSNLIVNGSTHF